MIGDRSHLPAVVAYPLAYAVLALLGIASLAWSAMAFVLYPLMPARPGSALGRSAISRIYRSLWCLADLTGILRLDTRALDALRDEPGLVIAANHPSMLDAMMLVARLPRSTCIMKAELMRNVFLGAGARLARYIRNDSPRGMIRMAVQDVKSGGQLIIFPEGTRTTHPPLNPFRPGFALIAKLAGAPIQTVFIDTNSAYLGKGWPLWRLPLAPAVFTVRIGKRFAPGADANAQCAELERYFAAHVSPPPQAERAHGRMTDGAIDRPMGRTTDHGEPT